MRFLVEEDGFRAVSLEMASSLGRTLDAHIRTGVGDPVELLATARPFWRFGEIVDLVRWLRDYAVEHPDDPVRLLGADAGDGPDAVNDADDPAPDPDPVTEQVAARAPELAARPDTLAYIERHLAETSVWWHERTGARIVHWGGSGHTDGTTRPTGANGPATWAPTSTVGASSL